MKQKKRKSDERWQQFNFLVDKILPTLPNGMHRAVLMICFRHGRGPGDFSVSTKRIAASAGISDRQVQRIIDDLEAGQVIRLTEEHKGPLPRRYRITFKAFNGDTHVTIRNSPPPDLMVTPTSANGDTHVA